VISHFDWRSPATYNRTELLEPVGLAWECLRRNAEYQQEYQALAGKAPDPNVIATFRKKWGLSFRS
jgi:hypothetical protein